MDFDEDKKEKISESEADNDISYSVFAEFIDGKTAGRLFKFLKSYSPSVTLQFYRGGIVILLTKVDEKKEMDLMKAHIIFPAKKLVNYRLISSQTIENDEQMVFSLSFSLADFLNYMPTKVSSTFSISYKSGDSRLKIKRNDNDPGSVKVEVRDAEDFLSLNGDIIDNEKLNCLCNVNSDKFSSSVGSIFKAESSKIGETFINIQRKEKYGKGFSLYFTEENMKCFGDYDVERKSSLTVKIDNKITKHFKNLKNINEKGFFSFYYKSSIFKISSQIGNFGELDLYLFCEKDE